MNTFTNKFNLIFIAFLLIINFAKADIIPDNTHEIIKKVYIENTDAFPDYTVLGYIETVMPNDLPFYAYKIHNSTLLYQDYKRNSFQVLAIKNKFIGNRNLNITNWIKDKHILKTNIPINCNVEFLDNKNPIYSKEIYYKIDHFTDSTVILYKSKEQIAYMNGSPTQLFSYIYNGKKSILKSTQQFENKNYSHLFIPIQFLGFINFLKSLCLTVIIETLLLFALVKTLFKNKNISNKQILFTGIIASFCSLPFVWFVYPLFINNFILYIITAELFAITFETFFIKKTLKINYLSSIFISTLCNLTSFSIGAYFTFHIQ